MQALDIQVKSHSGGWTFSWAPEGAASLPETTATLFRAGSSALLASVAMTAGALELPTAALPGGVQRPVFELRCGSASCYVAERVVPMQGASNFRDFGGYFTSSGAQVRWGKLFRSGQLSQLEHSDLTLVEGLGIGRICDFRREEEAERQPSRLPASVVVDEIPISPGSSVDFMEAIATHREDFDEPKIDQFMREINEDLAINHSERYAAMFAALLESEQGVMIHCSAGKDRTGLGAALILGALGVSIEIILQDYLLTNECVDIDREVARWSKSWDGFDGNNLNLDSLAIILGVKQSYLEAALACIEGEYGSIGGYVERRIGLGGAELEQLRARYLYNPS